MSKDKLIRIFEGINDLPKECKDTLLLNARLTEGEFEDLKHDVPNYYKKPFEFWCEDCQETKLL